MNKGLQKVYSEIPASYELINHVLTFGMDIICRKKAALIAVEDGGERWLDVCCGTGEMAVNLVKLSGNGTRLHAADFSFPMVKLALLKPETSQVSFAISEAEHLPYPDDSFDLITISFATRNLNSSRDMLIKRFREFFRVLKPGGRFINLETSQPELKFLKKLMHLYVNLTVKQVGSLISGNKAGYAYLAASIPRFYGAEELAGILKKSGFSDVSYTRMFLGITAVHKAVKDKSTSGSNNK